MARAYVDGLRRSVEKFVKEQFAPFEITAVEIYEDAERDSFPILDIVVFFNGTTSDLARREPPGFISKLRELLAEQGEYAFPLVSFQLTRLQAA